MKKPKPELKRQRRTQADKTPAKPPKAVSTMPKKAQTKAAPVAKTAARPKRPERLKLMVSSTVYGHENLLDAMRGLLDSFGYEVWMSVAGTLKVNPRISAMTNCIEAVEKCDLFLGLILPRYGSGRETEKARSITHRELLKAVKMKKPRWFLVHEHVAVARQLLEPFRDESKKPRFQLKDGIDFTRTPVLDDLRVLEMYEAAMRHDITEVAARTGNWVQPFGDRDEALLFASSQFRRYREVMQDLENNLKNEAAIRARVKGGRK